MRNEVLGILTAAAWKLRAVRAAEAAAIGAVAGGLAAAALEAAWAVARVSVAWGVAFCGAAAVLAIALSASSRLRSALGLDVLLAGVSAGVCGAAALGGAACVVTGWHVGVPKLLLPLLCVPGGALAGAVAVAARGVTAMQAAIFHDVRLGLDERLGTAVELAGGRAGDEAFARCVYAQALAALRQARPQRQAVWRRTRATAGALALSAALWSALAFVPTLGVVDVDESFARVRAGVDSMTPAQREDLAGTLRRLAEQAADNPRLMAALRAAALAAEHELPQEVREQLEQARRALADASDAEAARLARELLAAMGLDATAGGAGAGATTQLARRDANQPGGPDANSATGGARDGPLARRVYVYDPAYDRLADANAPPTTSPAPARAGSLRPLSDAWAAARDRARGALSAGQVPADYRRLVRRFFELD